MACAVTFLTPQMLSSSSSKASAPNTYTTHTPHREEGGVGHREARGEAGLRYAKHTFTSTQAWEVGRSKRHLGMY